MFGSWKKILEYLEKVFELLTQSKAELEMLKSINKHITQTKEMLSGDLMLIIELLEKANEKER